MVVNLRAVVTVTAFCLVAASASYGQDATSAPADQERAKGLDVHGSFDVGYRFRSLDGSHDTFGQLFDLTEGPRLLVSTFTATRLKGRARLPTGLQ